MGWTKHIFLGEYEVVLTGDGGLIFPAAYIKLLEEGSVTGKLAVITYAGGDALHVYPEQAFETYVKKLRESRRTAKTPTERRISSELLRAVTAPALNIRWDEDGRVFLPERVLAYADFKTGTNLILLGMGSYFDICNGENAKFDINKPDFFEEINDILEQYEKDVYGESHLSIFDGSIRIKHAPGGGAIKLAIGNDTADEPIALPQE